MNRTQMETLADATPAAEPSPTPSPIEAFRPFPVDSLPEPLKSFVAQGAKAIGCDPSYLALPLLTAAGSVIGNSRWVEPKPGWLAPPVLWTAVIGESGTMKSPAIKAALEPLAELQALAFDTYESEYTEHRVASQHHDREMKAWRSSKDGASEGDPPIPPDAPTLVRHIVSDTTVEALAQVLKENPRGVLLVRDELGGWIGDFDRYAGGRGGDVTRWLSMYDGGAVTVDRKTGPTRVLHVNRASVSVTGGIQPGILRRALGQEHRENGLLARILMTWPPRKAKRWSVAVIAPSLVAEIGRLFEQLRSLEPETHDDHLKPRPVRFDAGSKEMWEAYYNSHNAELAEFSGDLAAAWSKLEGVVPRLALIVHMTRSVAGDPGIKDPDLIDLLSLRMAIEITEWFKHEARRVYARLDGSREADEQHELADWIRHRGGSITVRDLTHGRQAFKGNTKGARDSLESLVDLGFGGWDYGSPSGTGGRPTTRFVLATSDAVPEIPTHDPFSVGSGDGNDNSVGCETQGEHA